MWCRRATLLVVLLWAGVSSAGLPDWPADGWRWPTSVAPNPDVTKNCDIAVQARNDSVFVAWVENASNRVLFKLSANKGFTWGTTREVSITTNPENHLSLAIDTVTTAVRYIYVLWSHRDPSTGKSTLKFGKTTNFGQNWSISNLVSNVERTPCGSMCVDATGRIHVAYYKYIDKPGTDTNRVKYAFSTNFGSTWTHQTAYTITPGYWPTQTTITTAYGSLQPQIVSNIGWISGSAANLYHTYKWAGKWYTIALSTNLETQLVFYNQALVSDVNNALHLVYRELDAGYYRIAYVSAASPDGGLTWPWPTTPRILDPNDKAEHPSARTRGTNLYVVWVQHEAGYDLIRYNESRDYGATWSNPIYVLSWVGGGEHSTLPCLALGTNEKHLLFRNLKDSSPPPELDLGHTSFDDLLLSDSYDATAYNWGRHLVRDFTRNRLYATYHHGGRPYYAYSEDDGATWGPFHVMENLPATDVYKDSGSYPTVGLVPGNAEVFNACLVYVDNENEVEYRWVNDLGQWNGLRVRTGSNSSNGTNGPPSVAALGDGQVHVLIPVTWPTSSAIVTYSFAFNAAGPGTETVLDQIGDPAALAEPCITEDGNYDLHCVWRKNGDIRYAKRISGTWYWDTPQFPLTPAFFSKTPFIEYYGDQIAVPYVEEEAPNNTDVYWTMRSLPSGNWVPTNPQDISNSSSLMSDCPSSASVDFTVWSEQRAAGTNYDVEWYWHSDSRYGWAGQTPSKSYFAHSVQYEDLLMGSHHLITTRTEGDGIPYRIATRCESLLATPGGEQVYYPIETGNSSPSYFCTKRDSFVKYTRYNVDLGGQEIDYTLTFLDPRYPAYKVKILSYYEGAPERSEAVFVDGIQQGTLELKPNILHTTELLITRQFYKDDHKVVLSFRGAKGVTKAGLLVYQLEKVTSSSQGSGSTQSADLGPRSERVFGLHLVTNPVTKCTRLVYTLPWQSKIRLTLHDATGRLMRVMDKGIKAEGRHSFGLSTPGLAQGVYFVRLETANQATTVKVVIVR